MKARWLWITALVLTLPLSLAQAADAIDRLMGTMAAQSGGTVRFVERRYLAMLDAPVVSRGEMQYRAPDWLERRTLSPRPERMLLDKDTLTLERDKRRITMPVNQRPEVEAFVASVRSTLQGDRATLERHFKLELQENAGRWFLSLVPREARLLGIVKRIELSGVGALVDRIDYTQADGDRTEMRLEPLAAGKP